MSSKITIKFKGETIISRKGENLRAALLNAGCSPHNGTTKWLNCKGMGTCGTCAVEVAGRLSPKTRIERWRLDFPPHQSENGLRLACQSSILGPLTVKKHDGFWGQKMTNQPPLPKNEGKD